MTIKTCLRCDWEGETNKPRCPNCGGQSLYVVGASPSGEAGMPVRSHPEKRSRDAASAASMAPSGIPAPQSEPSPSPTDEVEPSGRSAPLVVVVVLAALVLIVTLGTWLKVHEERSAPAASTDAAVHETPAGDGSPTTVVSPLGTPAGKPASTGTGPSVPVPRAPEVDYVIHLNTGVMTPLPETIIRSLGETAEGDWPESQYAAPPNGSRLAYVGTGDAGSPAIFIAAIDGARVRQVTNDPRGATSPAWSPDGRMIAYGGYGSGDVRNVFVLEVAAGETRQVTDRTRDVWWPQFTPDGSSLLYSSGTDPQPLLLTVPVAGGESTILFGDQRGGMGAAANGSMSPDGSLVTMMGNEPGGPGAGRFLANADGTGLRSFPGCYQSIPAGTWSPDGSRIVCQRGDPGRYIAVIDIGTGAALRVAEGSGAIWLDDHTLLVEV